jgi:hypothetical protein
LCFSAMCLRLRSGMVSSSKYRTVLQSIFSTQYSSRAIPYYCRVPHCSVPTTTVRIIQ